MLINILFMRCFPFERLEAEVEEHHAVQEEVAGEEVVAPLHKIQNLKKNQYSIFQNTWTRKYASNLMEDARVCLEFISL